MKHILITAYDVNPYKGSESATGWNYPYYLSKDYKITLVTRNNNLLDIERFVSENNIDISNIKFVGFDLPKWAMFWKKGARGSFAYFYLWQLFLPIRFWSTRKQFDVCHALNFHCDWAPSFLWLLGRPLVWGPINHNRFLPRFIFDDLSLKNKIAEVIKNTIKVASWKFDPFIIACKIKSNKILIGHDDVAVQLNLPKSKYLLFNQVATHERERNIISNDAFKFLFVGRGLPIKNIFVLLKVLKECLNKRPGISMHFDFVGVGRCYKQMLEKQAAEYGVLDYVSIYEWVEFCKMDDFYASSSVFCFPSFEGAGMVIPEALANGTPVITIDGNGASHELSKDIAFVVPSNSEESIVHGFVQSALSLIDNKDLCLIMSSNAYNYSEKNFSWRSKSKKLQSVYEGV